METGVMKAFDAELLYKGAAGLMRLGAEYMGGGRPVIEDHDDLRRIVHMENFPPARLHEIIVEQDGGLYFRGDDIARPDPREAAVAGQNFLDRHHAHDQIPPPGRRNRPKSKSVPVAPIWPASSAAWSAA